MTHYTPQDEHVPSWPVGSSIAVKFIYDGDESGFIARAALIKVSTELKEKVEAAARLLSINESLRTVQFYWPIDIITNEIYGQPIPKQFSNAILDLLDSDFEQAIPDTIACDAIQRVSSLDAITWISVGRNPLFTFGGIVEVGCTTLKCLDFKINVLSLTTETQVPNYSSGVDSSKQLVRAIEDLAEWALQIEGNDT